MLMYSPLFSFLSINNHRRISTPSLPLLLSCLPTLLLQLPLLHATWNHLALWHLPTTSPQSRMLLCLRHLRHPLPLRDVKGVYLLGCHALKIDTTRSLAHIHW